ncbi:MAG TPA: WG repeat-containing protein [Saprospiraceae bacterium]|nr:WG repeat-containing protein [Saprospiraceae bacterium]
MKKLLFIILLLPLGVFAQVEEEYEIATQAPVEELSSEEAFKRSIPAHFKDGKPHYHRYNNLSGYIRNDSILIPLKYENIETRYSDFMICREPRKRYGAINKKGETVVPFEYNTLSQNAAGIVLGWKKEAGYGLMTSTGKILVPFEYKSGFFNADSVVVLYSPGKQLIVKTLDGKTLKVLMEADFEDISIETTGRRPIFAVKQQGRWGIMDYQKRLLLPCEYDKIQRILGQHVVAVKNGKMGVVNLNNTPEVPFEYETIHERLRNGLFPFGVTVSRGKQRWGLVDSTGHVVLPAGYDAVAQFYHCDLMKVSKDGKWGILDMTGKLRSPLQFSDISGWKHLSATVKKDPLGKPRIVHEDKYGIYFVHRYVENGKIGLWHLDKGEIIPPQYDYFAILDPGGPIEVTLNEKRALFNMKGKPLSGFEYDALGISAVHPAFVTAHTDGKRTLVSTSTGKQIQPEYYDDWYFNNIEDLNGYFVTKIGKFTALHAPDGRRLTPHKYSASMAPCGSLPEVEAVLQKGRKLVACAKIYGDTTIRFFAIDDTGAEYEYDKK